MVGAFWEPRNFRNLVWTSTWSHWFCRSGSHYFASGSGGNKSKATLLVGTAYGCKYMVGFGESPRLSHSHLITSHSGNYRKTTDRMSIHSYLQGIGLVQYAQTIQDHGFETWQDLASITESDLEQIGILLGHRRKLQRALHLSLARESETSMTSTSEQ